MAFQASPWPIQGQRTKGFALGVALWLDLEKGGLA